MTYKPGFFQWNLGIFKKNTFQVQKEYKGGRVRKALSLTVFIISLLNRLGFYAA